MKILLNSLSSNFCITYLFVVLAHQEKKKELMAQAVAAMELQLDIIEWTESQKIKLRAQCDNKLSELQNPDPKLIARSKWTDDLTNWP